MVGVMMVVQEEITLVQHLTVEVVAVVLQVQEQDQHKEIMVVEVCYSHQRLEIPLILPNLLDHLKV